MDRPLASVHIITYNQRPYIAQAIEGAVQQQTSFPFEVVIGEDCSTDGTREVVFDYQKRYPDIVRVLAPDHNLGAYANSDGVHAACQGKYIAYCDGDDFWHHPQKLQMQVDFLESHPDFGLVHTEGDWLVQATGERISCWHKTYRCPVTQGDAYEDLLVANQIMTVTVCARKEHVDRCLHDRPFTSRKSIRPIGDYPVWLFIAMGSKIGYLDISTGTHREVLNSASISTDVRENYAIFLAGYEVQEYFLQVHPPTAGTAARIRGTFHRAKLKHGYIMQDVQAARDSYLYLAESGLLSLTDRLHYFGSKGRVHHLGARTLIALKNTVREAPLAWRRAAQTRRTAG